MSFGSSLGMTNRQINEDWGELHLLYSSYGLVSQLARWATALSPYTAPDNLVVALRAFEHFLESQMVGHSVGMYFRRWTIGELRDLLNRAFETIPEIERWNHSKNDTGQSFIVVTRYGGPAPDDDFIDLGALAHNVCYSAARSVILDADIEELEEAQLAQEEAPGA